jgi:PcRGLX-like N-terminal RIFT barrel domain/PcRGLX-like protein central beta sandwich domain
MRSNTELTVSFCLEEAAGLKRVNEPVTVGLPFPQGIVSDPSCLSLWDASGCQLSLQSRPLARWFDGSVKWLLLDFQACAEANSRTTYQLRLISDPLTRCQPPSLSVHESAEQIVVDTGTATFFLNRRLCKPFDRVVIEGAELTATKGSSFVLTDEEDQAYLSYVDDLAVETKGPLRVTIKVRGEFRADSCVGLARFVMRLSFFAGSRFVRIEMTVHNPKAASHPGGLWDLGDEGSIYFKDLSLHIPMRTLGAPQIAWTTDTLHPLRNTPHPVTDPLYPAPDPLLSDLEIYQDSSGGENWRSTNHINRLGRVMQRFRGYRVEAGQSLIEEGYRATPVLAVYGETGSVAATIDKFWQNFPNALEAHSNELNIRLFPRQYSDVFELQGGEQKTHTLYLGFSGQGEEPADLAWTHERIVPRATPEWYADSKACPYLSPLSQDTKVECQELIDGAVSGSRSFFARREIIDEYGWRHFGDLYADHEAVGHTADTPLVAHYNNQYDVIYGAIVQYLRSGDRRWSDLVVDLARHVIDVDIYHTEEDHPAYNGGLFWHTDHYLDAGTATHRAYSKAALAKRDAGAYGGGPSNEQNYTSGLLHYYYLTGDETAREAVLSLADWVINMDDGAQRPFGTIDRRPTGLCSSTASRGYHGPGRGAGNSINALLDAYVLTHDARYFVKAEQLIRRCIHPKDNIKNRNLDEPEHRWSYLVFIQSLGKYLDCKIDKGEIDCRYAYAQASLLHYAEWMLEHEVPYATVLHKVKIPTETWPAQDIRKSVVFHLAAKHATGHVRERFRAKASIFFQTCIRDLLSFSTCTLTRPIVLLLTNAYVHPYFQQHPEETAPQPKENYDFGEPQQFRPQFAELYCAREKFSACISRVVNWRQRMVGFLGGLTTASMADEARGKQRAESTEPSSSNRSF